MTRLVGFLMLAAGLIAAFGRNYLDIVLPDGDFRPVGFVLIAVGGVMVLRAGRRRSRKGGEENDRRASKTSSIGYRRPEPEKRKPDIPWGRGGED